MPVHVGSSGFSYDFWKGSFYPEDMKSEDMLAFYASRFDAVEINNTFYRMPKSEVVQRWSEVTPQHFRFVIKASRRITHQARLEDCEDSVDYLFDKLEPLGDKLGAVLFQLPPYLRKNVDRLQRFLTCLPRPEIAVIEFRHRGWFCEEVYDVLRQSGSCLCIGDYEGKASEDDPLEQTPRVATSDLGYLRLRDEQYDDATLARWAADLTQGWEDAYVFFKHEESAPVLIERMKSICAGLTRAEA